MTAPRHMRREDDVDLDYSERNGFLTGKAAALADWSFRKEDREFKKLCEKLYKRKWFQQIKAEGGERWQRLRARLRATHIRWRENNRERSRELARKAAAKKRAKKRPVPPSVTCGVCGEKRRVRAARTDFARARWCSKKCSNLYWAKHRKPRNRGIRQMNLVPLITSALQAGPMTLAELRAAIPSAKPGSLATKLCTMVQAGELADDGKRMRRRYSLPESRRRAA